MESQISEDGTIVPMADHPAMSVMMSEQNLPDNPGEIALMLLMKEFVVSAQSKIDSFCNQERPLSKSLHSQLQRGKLVR